MKPRLFGTLFYSNYLVRALALHRSLEVHFGTEYLLVMLVMDELSRRTLDSLQLPHVRVFPIEALEVQDPAIRAVKSTRSVAEYSWTCAPALMRSLLTQVP